MSRITVLGSGVSGLSSAVNLQRAGFDVHIITRDLPQFTTSMAAGAVWSGMSAYGRARRWAQVTLEHFLALSQQADSGVSLRRMRKVFAHPADEPWYQHQLPFIERIPEKDLPPNCRAGYVMDVPIVAPPLYLKNLHDQFLADGGTLTVRQVETLRDLADDHQLLVNCTGVWAREVASDPAVYPIRGQTLLIDAPRISEGYMHDGEATYLFPRDDGILIGGIYQYDSWSLNIDPLQTADIIERCAAVEPSVVNAPLLRQSVGLRPGREQVRLEVERLSPDRTVIHNYGHGSIGYTLSWGCGKDVTDLALQLAETNG